MRVVKNILASCCATVAVTMPFALTGNAQQGPVLDLTPDVPIITNCELKRNATGVFSLHLEGNNIRDGATMTINGVTPKKLKYKNEVVEGIFSKIIGKGRICGSLPGSVMLTNPNGGFSSLFQCNLRCEN
jgi:hypothetical protein